jgi:hypothetical protein
MSHKFPICYYYKKFTETAQVYEEWILKHDTNDGATIGEMIFHTPVLKMKRKSDTNHYV